MQRVCIIQFDKCAQLIKDIVKIKYGIERIPDIMVMKEMELYREGLNVDRLISLGALIAFAKVQEANRGIRKRIDKTTDKKQLQKSEKMSTFTNNPFRHIGMGGSSGKRPPRNPFKNIR